MSVSQATIDLIFKATNLAGDVAGNVAGSLAKVGDAGVTAAGRVAGAFAGMGKSLAAGLGQSVENLTTGGDLGGTLVALGGFMAGELTQNFGEQMLEKLAGSGIVAAIAAPLGAIGTAAGSLIAAAIPIGMAALPFILIGALVAAITVLIVNPEIRGKVIAFVGDLVGHIGDALRTGLGILAEIIPKAVGAAWQLVVDNVPKIIGAIIDLWQQLPFKLIGLGGDILRTIIGGLAGFGASIAKVIGDAFNSLHLDIGPFHISAQGVRVDLPDIHVPGFASGVTNFRGGLAVVGEKGPELVHLPPGTNVYPNGAAPQGGGAAGGSASGVFIQGVTQDQLLRMVDEGMFFRLSRAPS